MQTTVTSTGLRDVRINLPASKSISNRALIINALSGSDVQLSNVSACDDTFVMERALAGQPDTIDVMAAGTAMRFLSAYCSVRPGERVVTGTERMRHRPIGVLVEALRALGATVEYVGEEGFPPLRITGGCHRGGVLTLPGNVSSQYISALLMIGPAMETGLVLNLEGDIVSRPYIDMTLRIMTDFGAEAGWTGERQVTVKPVAYRPVPYRIENDWSAASYWYEIVALSSRRDVEVVLPGLFADSYQGDSAVARLFVPLGVETEYGLEDGVPVVRLRRSGRVAERYDCDFVNQPDLAQTFVVTCAMLGVPFRFTGLQSLKIKETDRMAALIAELRKLGYPIKESDGSVLYWDGKRCEPVAEAAIDTYEDHRMAMAFAPCALVLPELRVNTPGVVTKSYPRYWDDLACAGFELQTR
ncbi:MAG: 3-phosphoshikimate 1-carboxyvinyltransferase [Clostridium sp.]|nr:3-phosphoshikimate 1-carboxyvinyltransferase [Clostridium sp.]